MGSPSGPPFDPDDPDRERRERDTEPIPRIGPDDGPDYGAGPGLSDGPSLSDDVGYGDGPGYAGQGRSGRAWIRDPDAAYQQPQISEDELAGLRADATGSAPRRVLPLEDEPSSLVARYLFPTERYRGEWKRHWIHLTNPLLIGVAATFVLGYLAGFLAGQAVGALTTIAVLLWFAVMGWVAWKVADWWYDRFILTNKRVMVVNGIVTRKVAMMPLVRVTDMKYEQTPTGRALNYGTFVLESAGQEQALREIKNLPNPNELYLRVVEEMYEPQAVEARLGKEADEAKADDGA
ncbi:PH domain-containing protein [Micromonospora luteifusca]|uniref:Membrane protein YdbS with pleckstrin-like domain n=1 Tax=Micromonospora luteifusca TaxID=709860 RepID=A0ABS2LVZ8_9ACTN|nr:PH domain-containing protein [Micromonospora luteifusca]MBM7492347.1 membrane protein YdbS with pleckstrin-like domain [Micromonospora luteifusca]